MSCRPRHRILRRRNALTKDWCHERLGPRGVVSSLGAPEPAIVTQHLDRDQSLPGYTGRVRHEPRFGLAIRSCDDMPGALSDRSPAIGLVTVALLPVDLSARQIRASLAHARLL